MIRLMLDLNFDQQQHSHQDQHQRRLGLGAPPASWTCHPTYLPRRRGRLPQQVEEESGLQSSPSQRWFRQVH